MKTQNHFASRRQRTIATYESWRETMPLPSTARGTGMIWWVIILAAVTFSLARHAVAENPATDLKTPAITTHVIASSCKQAAKADQVRKFLEVSGEARMLREAMPIFARQLMDAFAKMRPDIPAEVWEKAADFYSSDEVVNGLVEQRVPIYQQHFCADDIQQLIAFYQSPAGQKMSASRPAILLEADDANEAYFNGLKGKFQQYIARELSKPGVKIGQPPKAPGSDGASKPTENTDQLPAVNTTSLREDEDQSGWGARLVTVAQTANQ